MLAIGELPQAEQERDYQVAVDPQNYEDIKTKCEVMKDELAGEIEKLSNRISWLARQQKPNHKEINLHHDLCAVNKALTKSIDNINVYFK